MVDRPLPRATRKKGGVRGKPVDEAPRGRQGGAPPPHRCSRRGEGDVGRRWCAVRLRGCAPGLRGARRGRGAPTGGGGRARRRRRRRPVAAARACRGAGPIDACAGGEGGGDERSSLPGDPTVWPVAAAAAAATHPAWRAAARRQTRRVRRDRRRHGNEPSHTPHQHALAGARNGHSGGRDAAGVVATAAESHAERRRGRLRSASAGLGW